MKNLKRDWKSARLADTLSRKVTYGIVQPGEHVPGGMPIIRSQDYSVRWCSPEEIMRVAPDIERPYTRSRVSKGDLLITVVGANIGKIATVPDWLDGANISRSVARVSVNSSVVHPNYLRGFLEGGIKRLLHLNSNGGAQPVLNLDDLREFEVPLPSLPEQQKIADILGTWDKALEKINALIAAKERRKQTLAQQLLTAKRRLSGYSKPWHHRRFGELMKTEDRYVPFDDDHLYYLVSARRRAEGVFFREALHGRDIKTKVMKRVHAGDLIISRMQVVHGGVGVVPPECDGYYASDSYEVLVPHNPELITSRFIRHLCRERRFWHRALVCSHGVHIEKMTFVMSDFENEKFLVPDVTEQTDIANVLDAADAELDILRKKRDLVEQQKRGLMQQLLTGRKRVRV